MLETDRVYAPGWRIHAARAQSAGVCRLASETVRSLIAAGAKVGVTLDSQFAIQVVLTVLSLSLLAQGMGPVTKAPAWESWLMAIGIDLGFVALEIGLLCAATPRVRAQVGRFTGPAILGTLVASAAMNALAFGAAADGWLVYPADGLGLAIPALIYCLSKVSFGLAASR